MPGSATTIKTRLQAEAKRLGFALFGVTSPRAVQHFNAYAQWIAAGRHGSMAYLATEEALGKRADPRRVLPDARAIIVVGLRYPSPSSLVLPADGLRGCVAAYAWGDDYHQVISPRLDALHAYLDSLTGVESAFKRYTDTGPVLERDLAQAAGLGWAGKNTCLINPRGGSYTLLGEILTSAEIEPDPPETRDLCGSCTRCIDACPTGCILPNRTLDARRCISYLTIEHKGAIDPLLRAQMGTWVFGCDVCQAVCPWNIRFAPREGEPQFSPRAGLPFPDLPGELALTREQFNRKFKDSPVQRSKRRGYLRNVCIALGNLGDPRALPALAQTLAQHDEPLVRGAAAWALGQIGGGPAQAALASALEREGEASVRSEIVAALQR